jgi:competence protein ComEA
MSPSHPTPRPRSDRPLLKRMDQAAIAALTMAALLGVAAYWVARGGTSGRLIEIERAQPRAAQFQLDINKAEWPEFSVLPGIGETLARRIVESRSIDGPFADVDQLQRVSGIGPKTLETIRPYLRPLPAAAEVAGQ